MPKTKKTPTQEQRQQQLGQMLTNIYETGYLDRNTMYKMSFFKGIVAGLGGVIGATIVIALLIWVLSFFSQIPLIGRLSDNVKQTVQTQQ